MTDLWVDEIKNFGSRVWWLSFLFFSWRRLRTVWPNPYFLFSVLWLQIICIWGGVGPLRVGCFCFDPVMPVVFRVALLLVQVWYFYLLGLLVRVSLYPHTTDFFRRIERERGLGWVLQLLVAAVVWALLLDIPVVWLFCMFWFLIAADGAFLGGSFFWRLLVCTTYSMLIHLPSMLLLGFIFYGLAYWWGSALILYFVLVPVMFSMVSVLYTQGLARTQA